MVAKERVRGRSPISIRAGDSAHGISQCPEDIISYSEDRATLPKVASDDSDNRILCIPVPFSRSSKAVECGWEKASEEAWRPGPSSADGGSSVEWEWLVGNKQSHQVAASRELPRVGSRHRPGRVAPWFCQLHCGLSALVPLSPRLGGVGKSWGLNWPSEAPWTFL